MRCCKQIQTLIVCHDIQGTKSTLRITLEPFAVEQVQEFMQQMLEGTAVSHESAAQIAERTGGLPLYVEQVKLQAGCRMSPPAFHPTGIAGAAGTAAFCKDT